jgi:hypothetical protein
MEISVSYIFLGSLVYSLLDGFDKIELNNGGLKTRRQQKQGYLPPPPCFRE